MVTLRQRNRLNAMRSTQRLALPMFVEHGFDRVTVEEVAAEAGMAASTLYRHFATKEDIVLWDEHETAIDQELTRRLKLQKPLEAVRDVFVETLGDRYDADIDFQLARIQYIYATEQLHAAAVEADFRDRAELTAGIEHFLSKADRPKAAIIAGAALLALDVALDQWQQQNAKRPLGEIIKTAFETLSTLDTIG